MKEVKSVCVCGKEFNTRMSLSRHVKSSLDPQCKTTQNLGAPRKEVLSVEQKIANKKLRNANRRAADKIERAEFKEMRKKGSQELYAHCLKNIDLLLDQSQEQFLSLTKGSKYNLILTENDLI